MNSQSNDTTLSSKKYEDLIKKSKVEKGNIRWNMYLRSHLLILKQV